MMFLSVKSGQQCTEKKTEKKQKIDYMFLGFYIGKKKTWWIRVYLKTRVMFSKKSYEMPKRMKCDDT